MNPLIFKVHRIPKPSSREVIRIDGEAFEIVKQFQRQTGFSAQYIVSEMVKYAADKVEIQVVE